MRGIVLFESLVREDIVPIGGSNSPLSDRQSSISVFSLMGLDNKALADTGGVINTSCSSGSKQG